MAKIFLAGIGGFIGSVLRYSVSGFVQDLSRNIDFPYGTLAVNLIGCFAIGFLSQLAETRGLLHGRNAYADFHRRARRLHDVFSFQ